MQIKLNGIKRDTPSGVVSTSPGTVALVGAGPGDPELITLKGLRWLKRADVILYDRLCNAELLNYTRADALKVSVGKQADRPSINQEEINKMLLFYALEGKDVVRLKGGDPFIFGRGGEECLMLARYGIPFEVIPGISSVNAVPAYAGIPLTMRNQATGFTVISGHLHSGSQSYDWSALARISTLVILMGLKNFYRIIDHLIQNGKSPNTPVALIYCGSTPNQKTITGTLGNIHQIHDRLQPPVTIVIGEVVALAEELSWFCPGSSENPAGVQPSSTQPHLVEHQS